MGASMRRVAVYTTLLNWRVFPDIGSSFFGMTGITEVIDRVCLYHGWPCGAVGIVTVVTFNLSFYDRVMGTFVNLGLYILMARCTGCIFYAIRILFMYRMAVCTCNIILFMFCRVSENKKFAILMTTETDG